LSVNPDFISSNSFFSALVHENVYLSKTSLQLCSQILGIVTLNDFPASIRSMYYSLIYSQ